MGEPNEKENEQEEQVSDMKVCPDCGVQMERVGGCWTCPECQIGTCDI